MALRLTELVLAELDALVLRGVLDRADARKRLIEAFGGEPLEAVGLNGDQVGNIHDVRNLREASAHPITAGRCRILSLSHEVFPP